MKKANITIQFEKEKLDALTFYSQKKHINIVTELEEMLQKIYEKRVPLPTREYLDAKLEGENKKQIIEEVNKYGTN